MPRAETSLRQDLEGAAGPLDISDSIAILLEIAEALAELDGRIVHRDLKPENVLWLDGRWRSADFGISRYAEATTAPDTQKFALSLPYAAPERWRGERATIATDVYSLGVIAFEMLSGSLPFAGPELHDFREQHLHSPPAALSGVPSALAALVSECLYKAPGARPSPANVVARLAQIGPTSASGGLARLRDANLAEVARRAERERRSSEQLSEAERRRELLAAATTALEQIASTLEDQITSAAPSVEVAPNRRGGWTIRLNQASLEFAAAEAVSPNPWEWGEAPAFDLIAHAAIGIRIPPDRYGYEGRSHSLWYCDAREEGRYQWFETAFMVSPLVPKQGRQDPFALAPGQASAKALWSGMAEWQLAWPFTPLTIGDLDEFVDRWAGWFASAAEGRLHRPGSMPERRAEGSWRRR